MMYWQTFKGAKGAELILGVQRNINFFLRKQGNKADYFREQVNIVPTWEGLNKISSGIYSNYSDT